jgi:hypothetical protein
MSADLGNVAIISPVDANNASGTIPYWSGSAAPSTIDDSGRALQGAIAREWENRSFAITSTGSANAYVVAYTVAPAALRSGQVYSFITNFAVTGSATVNINTLGAKTIKKDVAGVLTALSSGDMASGQFVMLAYNGTDMIWVNWQGPATAVPSLASTTEVLTGTDAAKTATPDAIAALWEKGSDKASAGTTSFDEGGYVHITGTTTITDLDFATAKDGRGIKVIFDGILTLTHNATTLILPGAANITTAAGDRAEFVQDSSDNIICLWYTKADGTAVVVNPSNSLTLLATLTTTSGTSHSATGLSPASYKYYWIDIRGVSSDNTTVTLQMAASGNNGANYGVVNVISAGLTAVGDSFDGGVFVFGINGTKQFSGSLSGAVARSDDGRIASFGAASSTLPKHATGGTSPIDALQFTFLGANNFDAGQILVYGGK